MNNAIKGHGRDQAQLHELLLEIEKQFLRVKECITVGDFLSAEDHASEIPVMAINLQKQLGIIPMRTAEFRDIGDATDEDIEKVAALDKTFQQIHEEVVEIKKSAMQSVQQLLRDLEIAVDEPSIEMRTEIGKSDFAYRAQGGNILSQEELILANDQNIRSDASKIGKIIETGSMYCQLFSELYDSCMPQLWLDDLFRIETVNFEITLTISKSFNLSESRGED